MMVKGLSDARAMLVVAVTDEWRDTPAGPRLGRVYWVRPPNEREDFPREQVADRDCVEIDDVAV